MRTRCAALSVLVLAGGVLVGSLWASAQEKADAGPHPTLQALKPEIEKLLKDPLPEAKVEMLGNALMASHQTRTFLVYPIDQTEQIAEDPVEVTGPDRNGFLLRLCVLPGKTYAGALATGQTVREPYWKTYRDAYPIKDRDEHVFLTLSFGFRADEKILAAIKETVAKVGK